MKDRADIRRMAEQAGAHHLANVPGFTYFLTRFAALVAAAEREACAKLAETTVCDTHLPTGIRIYGSKAAAAIRARGNNE
jgi:hypothetical protein